MLNTPFRLLDSPAALRALRNANRGSSILMAGTAAFVATRT